MISAFVLGGESMEIRFGVQQEYKGIRATVVFVAVSVYAVAQISYFGCQDDKIG